MGKSPLKIANAIALATVAATSWLCADTAAKDNQPVTDTVINPSGRPHVKQGANLFVTADWLIWEANETGLGFAIKTDTDSFSALGEGGVKSAEFDWEFGFRVGLGYNMGHDDWDLRLNWTWFQDQGTEHLSTDGDDFLYPSVIHPTSSSTYYATDAESEIHLHLNVLDLEMGRWMKVSKWLTIRPHAGLRTAWIYQRNTIEYDDLFYLGEGGLLAFDEYEVNRNCNYWGMGVRTGLDTQWGIGDGWSFYGNAAISLLYGFFDAEHKEESTTPSDIESTLIDLSNSYRAGRAITDLQLGVRWDYLWSNGRYHFGYEVAWEHHMFFSQNQFMTFVDGVTDGVFVQNQGDLAIQGWTMAFRLDF